MSIFRKLIIAMYPVQMKLSELFQLRITQKLNHGMVTPAASFYSLSATLNNGKNIDFEQFRGKKIIIVNTASNCGYTPQYAELEKVHLYQNEWIVLGFPSNDFKNQEPENDEAIAQFCSINYQITFPLFTKNRVTGLEKQKVFDWLTNPALNGWCSQEPQWNFSKYVIDENGMLVGYFSSAVSPKTILQKIAKPGISRDS